MKPTTAAELRRAGQALYDALKDTISGYAPIVSLGKAIYAKVPWEQLPPDQILMICRAAVGYHQRLEPAPVIEEVSGSEKSAEKGAEKAAGKRKE